MKRRDLLKHLHQHGCELIREGANHTWYGNRSLNSRSSIPRHTEIPDPLCVKICKDLQIPRIK